MRNGLKDLNDILFEQIERINDDELKGKALEEQLKKTDAITKVARQIVSLDNVVVQALALTSSGKLSKEDVPTIILKEDKKPIPLPRS